MAEGQLHTDGRRLLVNEVTFQATVGVWLLDPAMRRRLWLGWYEDRRWRKVE